MIMRGQRATQCAVGRHQFSHRAAIVNFVNGVGLSRRVDLEVIAPNIYLTTVRVPFALAESEHDRPCRPWLGNGSYIAVVLTHIFALYAAEQR